MGCELIGNYKFEVTSGTRTPVTLGWYVVVVHTVLGRNLKEGIPEILVLYDTVGPSCFTPLSV